MTKNDFLSNYIKLKQKNRKNFVKIYKIVKGLCKPWTIKDPSNINTLDDIENMAKLGLYHAISTYDRSNNASFKTWARRLMYQAVRNNIIRQGNRMMRCRNDKQILSISDEATLRYLESFYSSFKSFDSDTASKLFKELVEAVKKDDSLSSKSEKMVKILQLRMENPKISLTKISKILGLERSQALIYMQELKQYTHNFLYG